jgi:hypothetical protein
LAGTCIAEVYSIDANNGS